MSDINATRLPNSYITLRPYVGDEVNHTLIRGEKWAQHSSNDIPIVLMCRVLAFAEYLTH